MQIRMGIIIRIVLVVLLFVLLFNDVVSADITGRLYVKIGPSEVVPEAMWKLSNGRDLDWHASGEYVYNIPVGKNQLQFHDVSGWCKPPIQTIEIKKGKNIAYMEYSRNSCDITEDIKNIGCEEFLKKDVFKDKEVVYDFQADCNIIENIRFKGLRNYEMIPSKIEMLKSTSTRVDHSPPSIVYQNLNVLIGSESYISENNVADLSITFSVEKSWIEQNDIMWDSINLYKFYEGTWSNYPTEKIDEDSTHIYFTSYPNIENWGTMAVVGQSSTNPISISEMPVTPELKLASKPTPVTLTDLNVEKAHGFLIFSALIIVIFTLYIISGRR